MAEIVQVSDFRRILSVDLEAFINASKDIHELISNVATKVKLAFEAELDFIIDGVERARPNDQEFRLMIEPLTQFVTDVQDFRNKNRNNAEYINHLSTISETILALSWISFTPAPCQFVKDMVDAGDYYGNRVLSTYRGNQKHTEWLHSWRNLFQSLMTYVKDHHRTGFDWGVAKRTPGSAARGPVPPPPPPPPAGENIGKAIGGDSSMPSALLQELNQGVDIVRKLKPVTSKGAQSQVSGPSAIAPAQAKAAPAQSYPPKLILDGRKWRVEHQKNQYGLEIDNAEMSQSLAVYKCENSGLEVKNKLNGVTIDNTKRSIIVLSDIISSVELIRCSNVKVQCNGVVPLISIDNCDSVSIFLTKESIGSEIISSKSTSTNVCLLEPDGDYEELPVPEQIRTVVAGKKLRSTVVDNI